MKRKKTTYRSSLAIGVVVCTLLGCNDFLSEVPDNRVSLDYLDKAAQLLTNAYTDASPAFTDWMTDNVSYTFGVTLRQSHEEAYAWEEISGGPTEQDTPDYYWFGSYGAIAIANEVLAVIDDLPTINEDDERRKEAIEAEALLTRAYAHFMLVNMFGEHFDENASNNLGVPYVKIPETVFIQEYERESVSKVYGEVEDDLLDGLEKVNDNYYNNSGKYHFTRNAALAFASRFYLYKRDYQRSLQYSNELLGSNPSQFVRDMTSDVFQAAKSSIQGYPQTYSSPDLPSNILLMRKFSLIQRTDFAHGPSDTEYAELFGQRPFPNSTDERENPALVKGENGLLPVRYESLFQRNSLNSNVGFPYHIALAFRGEEILLNRAEIYAIQSNVEACIADLQIFTDRRYSGPDTEVTMERLRAFFGATNDPDFSDQFILLNYVLLERQKEFILQGLRWFDIKRYGLTISHLLADGISTIRLESEDPRKVMQIPESAIEVGGLEPNPR
jgi:hypothetical protein